MDLVQLINSIHAPGAPSFSPEFKVRSPKLRLVKTQLFSVYEEDAIPVYKVKNRSFDGALRRELKNFKVILVGPSAVGKTFYGTLIAKGIGGTLVDENDKGIAPSVHARHTTTEELLKNGSNAVVSYAAANWKKLSNSQLLETCADHTLIIATRACFVSRQHRLRTRKMHRIDSGKLLGQIQRAEFPSNRALLSDIAQFMDPSKVTLACIDNPLAKSEFQSGLAFGYPLYSCFSIIDKIPLENLARKYLPGNKDVKLKGKYHVTWQFSKPDDPNPRYDLKTDKMETDIKVQTLIIGKNISFTVKVLHADSSGKQVWMDTSPHKEGKLHITMHVPSGSTAKQSMLDAHDPAATVINVSGDVVVKAQLRLAQRDETIDLPPDWTEER